MSKPWENQKLSELIVKLVERTDADLLSWDSVRSPRRPNSDLFKASIARATFYVGSNDGDGGPPYIFEVVNDQGVRVESILFPGVRDISNFNFRDIHARQKFEVIVNELYSTARGSALGTNEALEDILSELNEEE